MKWLLLLLLAFPVYAEDITLTWTNPTRTFNLQDAGPLTNLAGSKIYMLVAEINDPSEEQAILEDYKPGTYEFVAVAVDDQGVTSPVSGHVIKDVTEFVTKGGPVYYIIQQPGAFIPLVIGNVPAGIPCNPDQEVNSLFSVPTGQVNYTGNVRPQIVVAACG